MRLLGLALLLLLGAGSAHAQLSTQCPLASRLQHGNAYTVSTADQCYWVVLDGSGVINVTVPTPSSTFVSGYTVALVPIGGGSLTLTVLPDPQTGNHGTINNVNPLTLVAGQQIELRVGGGPNWYGVISSNLSSLSFGAPPPIGNVTPNTGAFTTLSANSTNISGGLTAVNLAASTLALTGNLTSNITGPGPQCVHASSSGILSGTGTDCGSGGGGGGGTPNVFVGNTTGPANTYTMAVTVPGAFTLTDQFVVSGTISTTNTGSSTLNVGSTGAVAINKQTPSGFAAVAAGDLVAHLQYQFVYNAASGVYVVTNNTSVGTIPAPVSGDVIYGVAGLWTATPIASFGYITGNQTITLSGDTSGTGATAITTQTAKVNGVAYGTSPATNTVPVITSANTATYEAVPNAALANSSITINSHAQALGTSLTLAFTDFAGSLTAAQMLALPSGNVYYGNGSSQPVATSLSTLFASPPALGGSSAAAANITNLTTTGTITTAISGGGLQCLHVNNAGVISGTAADCSGAAGSGTVNAGTTNQVAYYPGNASTVGGENTLTLPQTHPNTRASSTAVMMRIYGAL